MPTMNWILRNRRRALRRLQGEGGFTIVELMVAISIFAILMAAAAVGMNGALNMTRNNRSRSVAANLASQQMDTISATTFSKIVVGQTTATQTVDGVVYSIETDSEWVGTTTSTGSCTGGSNANPAYLRVTVLVTWPQMNGILPVQSQTIITPPVGTYDANSGNISVLVLDHTAAPEDGVPVTVTDSSGNTTVITTTPDGCAFFAYLTPGTYTLSVHLDGPLGYPWVDGQRNATPTQTVAVSPGTTSTAQFTYDESGSLDMTLVGAAGGAIPNQIPLTVANTGLLPTGTLTIAGGGLTGPDRLVPRLFPYLSGYQVWAGTCLDADPQGVNPTTGQPYYPGATRDPAVPVSPGVTTPGNVTLSTLTARVVTSAGVPVSGAKITVTHAPDPVNGCTIGASYLFLGTTDSTGSLTGTVPYGLWTVSVSSPSLTPASGSWPQVTLAPPAPSTPTTLTLTVN